MMIEVYYCLTHGVFVAIEELADHMQFHGVERCDIVNPVDIPTTGDIEQSRATHPSNGGRS